MTTLLKFTNAQDGAPAHINPEYVVSVMAGATHRHTEVALVNGMTIIVKEPVVDVAREVSNP